LIENDFFSLNRENIEHLFFFTENQLSINMADGAARAAGAGGPVAVVQAVPQFRMVPGRRINEMCFWRDKSPQ